MRALLPILIAGCTGISAPPAPIPEAQHELGEPLVVAGESMVYELAFRGLRAARVQVAIGKPGWVDMRPAVIVQSRGQTDGVLALIGDLEWELSTTVDLESGRPIRGTETARIEFRGETEREHRDHGPGTHTIHSAATSLRGWRSVHAQKATFDVRILDAQLRVVLHEAAREFVDELNKPAVRYDGVARDKFPFKVWISDDAARVPLRMETATKWGDVSVALVDYEAPRD